MLYSIVLRLDQEELERVEKRFTRLHHLAAPNLEEE